MVWISYRRSSRSVANEWRNVWQPAGLVRPELFNGFHHSLLDHAWIQVMADFYPSSGVLPAVPPGKHPRADLKYFPDDTVPSHFIQRLEHAHTNQPNHLSG